MKTALAFAFVLFITINCGGPESLQNTESASLSAYNIGSKTTPYATMPLPTGIHSAHADGQMPITPEINMPSTGSDFDYYVVINNGGTASIPNGQTHGTGNLNELNFQIHLVNSKVEAPYYLFIVSDYWTDGVGGANYFYGIINRKIYATQKFQFDWANNGITLTVTDSGGHTLSTDGPFSMHFDAGTQPNIIYSPQATFTLNWTPFYDPCHFDILGYDDNVHDTGHFTSHTLYGANFNTPTFPAYISAPLTEPICQLQTMHYPNAGWDIIQWHDTGF